jgi:hypothetical protein
MLVFDGRKSLNVFAKRLSVSRSFKNFLLPPNFDHPLFLVFEVLLEKHLLLYFAIVLEFHVIAILRNTFLFHDPNKVLKFHLLFQE